MCESFLLFQSTQFIIHLFLAHLNIKGISKYWRSHPGKKPEEEAKNKRQTKEERKDPKEW